MADSLTNDPLISAAAAAELWTVGTFITVLRRRKTLLLRPIVAMLVLGVLYCAVAPRRYKSTGQIQVQKESSGGFGLESSVMGRDDNSVSTDSLDYNIMLQTEIGILQSNALALSVIRDLRLEETPDYFAPESTSSSSTWITGAAARMLFWRKPLEPLSTALDQAPNRRFKALKIFASHLKVEPVTGTRLVEVSYSDRNPVRSAAVVNHLIAQLGEFTFQQRFTATLQGSSWLTGQLADLRRQMQTLQAKALSLQRDTGMFGNDASRNVVLERLESLNQALTQAQSNRILKEAVDRVAASGDPELISSLSGNSGLGTAPSMTNSLTLIQNLRSQEAALRAELAQDSVRYGPAYPRVGELEAQLQGVGRSIEDEVHRLGARAHSDYLIAAHEEGGAQAAFDEQKRAAGKLNDSMLAYGLAKQEADSSRDIYESLLAKLKQAGVLEGLKANNITVVALAQVPPPNYPSSPRIWLVLLASIVVGLALGTMFVMVAELTDNRVRSFEGMERTLGIPLIAVLPVFGSQGAGAAGRWASRFAVARTGRLLLGRSPRSADSPVIPTPQGRPPLQVAALDPGPSTFAEGLRSLRTALLLARSGRPPQVGLVTSCLEAEGKTTLALNLAALYAQGGSRVLLVDADLRKPTVSTYFPDDAASGLGAALASEVAPHVRYPFRPLPGLAVLCGDEAPPFPAELLGSARMRSLLEVWRAEYDFIIFDSPPVLPVTDATLLSQVSDATLLVARHGQTTRQALRRSAEALRKQQPGHAALGLVLNGVSAESGDFYEYFGYQASTYAAGGAHA